MIFLPQNIFLLPKFLSVGAILPLPRAAYPPCYETAAAALWRIQTLLLHFDMLQTWENCHWDPSRPHHHLPWVLPYTQNHPTLGQRDPEWHFHPGDGSQLQLALDTRTQENIACVKELTEQNPRMNTWESAVDLSLPHAAVYEILKEDLMWFKWSPAVRYLASSQRGTRRREWSTAMRWLCCTRPMGSCF